jgi:pimeloyl-ACP methyl ester carboxylesterase
MSSFTEAWLPGPRSTSFYTRTYHPQSGSASGVVVFIHGFTEHVARYEYVHQRWADHGFAVFTFDQRGFGRTALDPKKSPSAVYGRTSDADQISDIEWALRVAQEANPTVPLFLMGHSMVRLCISSYLLALLLNSRLVRSTGRCIGTLVRDASQYARQRFAAVGNYCVKSLSSPHQSSTEYHTPAGRPRTCHPSEPEHTSVS